MESEKLKHLSNEALMPLVCKGNMRAFDELYRRFSSRLLHFFYRMLRGDEAKAQDFLQNLFLKIIEDPGKYDRSKNFTSWIFTIANNMCKNEYRKNEIQNRLSSEVERQTEAPVTSPPGHDIDEKAFRIALLRELDQHKDGHRSAFLLRYREQLSIKEISAILGCSEGTVKSRLFYTARKLAQNLKEYHPLHFEV